MNKDLLEDRWVQVKNSIKDKFHNLTDEDINQINGRYEQLIAKLQQRYGYSKEEAEEEIHKWVGPTSFGSEPAYSRSKIERESMRDKKTEDTSFFKWLLLLGIPLLLLAAYFASMPVQNAGTSAGTAARPPIVTEEIVTFTETPADQAMSQGIKSSLATNDLNLANVRINSSQGVVTLSGTVDSAQQRDAILRAVQNTSGVKQINNHLQVR